MKVLGVSRVVFKGFIITVYKVLLYINDSNDVLLFISAFPCIIKGKGNG